MGFIATAIAVAGAASAGASIYSASTQSTASKKAAAASTANTNAQIEAAKSTADKTAQNLKDTQAAAASQAQNSIRQRVAGYSQTVYTSPLGLQGQADTTKKTLLGA